MVTAKALKRKLESEFAKVELDDEDENPHKKIAPLLEKAEITITPIQKTSATTSTAEKQNGSAA